MLSDGSASKERARMFTTDVCQAFYGHWLAIRAPGEVAPARSALDLAAIPQILPRVIVYNVGEDPASVTYRLVGTEITLRWGFDPTGRSYADVVGGEEGHASAGAILRVAHEHLALRMVRRQHRTSGAVDEIEICCLPFWDDRRGVAQAMSVSGAIAQGQRSWDAVHDPVRQRELVARTLFHPDDPAEHRADA
jgi:hypothetical protein